MSERNAVCNCEGILKLLSKSARNEDRVITELKISKIEHGKKCNDVKYGAIQK